MTIDLASINFLKEKKINHEVKEFPPTTEKGAANVAKAFEMKPKPFIKTLVFEGESKEVYLCMVGGDQNIDQNKLAKATNENAIEMADPQHIIDVLGFKIGSIPPFGLKNKVKTYLDISLKDEPILGVGSGQWGVEIFLTPEDLVKASEVTYIDMIVKERVDDTDWDSLKLDPKYLPQILSADELQPAELLKDIENFGDKEVYLNGWVYNKRGSGKVSFLEFRDGSGDIQIVAEKPKLSEELWNKLAEITTETSLQVKGKVRKDERSPFGYEMDLLDFKIIQISPEFPIAKKDHGPAFLMDNRHLWMRSRKQRAVLKIRDEVFFSMTSFLREEGFVRIDTPIFQPVSCEDTSELFEVNYFGEKTYLTQSGQLYCEAAEMGLGRTYDFGPVFRAEKSKTRKHLIEFWMMDAELPFTNLKGLMNFEEKLLKRIISDCLKNCAFELKVLERDTTLLTKYVEKEFIRMTHKETIDLLNEKFDAGLSNLDDIGAPEEEKLSTLFDMPMFISEWPAEIKAFYMTRKPKQENDMLRVNAVDLVAPAGFGELMGGSERIFDYNLLLDVIKSHKYPYKDYKWYLDLRKYGTIPHSGFGIGMERTVRFISGVHHIRETIPFARMLNRMYP